LALEYHSKALADPPVWLVPMSNNLVDILAFKRPLDWLLARYGLRA
jgi:hypothetical protein